MPQVPYTPYRPQVAPRAGMDLPFNDPGQVTPYSPDELQARQGVMDSQTSLQDALGGQQQANAPQTGLAGFLSSPIFQALAPTALTTLSAIFPRHMANAGGIGMAGLRGMNEMNMAGRREHQTLAADNAKQRLDDFNRQRLKYAIRESDMDPSQASALEHVADVDVPAAAKGLETAADYSRKQSDFGKQVETFDPHSMLPGETRTITGPGSSQTFHSPEPTPYMDYSSGDPAKAERAKTWESLQTQGNTYLDATSDDPVKKDRAEAYMRLQKQISGNQTLETSNAERDAKGKEDIKKADAYLDGVMSGEVPPFLPSARGGMTAGTETIYQRAHERGIPFKEKQLEFAGQVALTKNLNTGQPQQELKNLRVIDGMLNITQQKYLKLEPYLTNMKVLNEAEIKAMTQFGGEAGRAATEFVNALTESRQVMGTVLRNGAAITDQSGQEANNILALGMPKENMLGAFETARQMNKMRQWAIVTPTLITAEGEHEFTKNPEPAPDQPDGQQFPTRESLAKAVSEGKISPDAAKKLSVSRGWRK